MCDDEIFKLEDDPGTSFQFDDHSFIPTDDASTSAPPPPPPSPEGPRKQPLSVKNITMDQLAKELSSLQEQGTGAEYAVFSGRPRAETISNCLREQGTGAEFAVFSGRPRAETISNIPMFHNNNDTRNFFQHKFMSIESQGYFGCFKSQEYEDDQMDCEDSFQQRNIPHSLHIPNSLNIRTDYDSSYSPFAPGGSCDPSPVAVDHLPFVNMMGSLNSDGLKKNSLKRRTNEKNLNSPYPHPGQECNDISKKSRSARSSPPFILYSHLSQSAPR